MAETGATAVLPETVLLVAAEAVRQAMVAVRILRQEEVRTAAKVPAHVVDDRAMRFINQLLKKLI
jgi:hypothetical protein